MLAINPRKIFGIEQLILKEGEKAVLTLFDPNKKWVVEEKNILSKSRNSPFLQMELKGKPLGIIHKNQLELHS